MRVFNSNFFKKIPGVIPQDPFTFYAIPASCLHTIIAMVFKIWGLLFVVVHHLVIK